MLKGILQKAFSLLNAPEHSVDEEKAIIDSFSEPRDDFDRTYFNYKCACWGRKKWSILLFNAVCFFAVPFFMLVYLVNRILAAVRQAQHHEMIVINADNRLGVHYSYKGRIPQALYEEYEDVEELQLDRFPGMLRGVLGLKVLSVWLSFFIRHPFSGFVNLRALVNLAGINGLVLQYRPKAIAISRAELNGMSSLTTHFCESCGIRYVNFMHGETFADIATAFVRFSTFYIWDEDYIDVFDWGRCARGQYVVYTPEIYAPIESDWPPKYYILYALSSNEKDGKDENAVAVRDILARMVEKGKACKIRPHPRWSDMQYVEAVFGGTGIDIERPRDISTRDSISETEIVVGTFSTVIAEAYYGGRKIALDDLSDPKLFDNLKKLKYIMFNKEHMLLSELAKQE